MYNNSVKEEKVKILTISFLNLGSTPNKLYFMGNFSPGMMDKCITVVGSRRITEYGRQVIKKMIPGLVQSGKIIVSGLMYGTDQAVHRECIECGGTTIAVLGWGINWTKTSAEEKELIDKIIKSGGAVISEWKDQTPMLWTFPVRDKVMAALSTDIYVTEAAIKSGSLLTADWGVKLGKKVWAVPGPVTSRVSEGTNWLIATGRAKMWLPGQQLSLSLDPSPVNKKNNVTEIYILLQNEALGIDDLAVKLNRSVEDLGAELTMMQIKGEVEEREGKYYIV